MLIALDANPIARERTGIGHYTFHLLCALSKISNHSFLLYYYNLKPEMRKNLYPASPPTSQNLVVFRPLLSWELRRHCPHLVHGTNYRLPATGQRGATMTLYDLAFLKFPGLVSPRTRELLRRKIASGLSLSPRVIAISECTKQDLCELFHYPEERVVVTPLAVDSLFLKPCELEGRKKVLQKYTLSPEYILFTGNLNARKNLLLLLEAYALFPDAPQLVLAGGEGNQSQEIRKKIVHLKLERKVKLLGYVPQEDLPALYQSALFFVYPSLYEGFGIPLLEAMASGTPIVAARGGAIEEIASDAAYFFHPRKVEELWEGLEKLLRDSSLRETLRKRGRERVAHFSWEKTAQKTLQAYAAICEEKKGERTSDCL